MAELTLQALTDKCMALDDSSQQSPCLAEVVKLGNDKCGEDAECRSKLRSGETKFEESSLPAKLQGILKGEAAKAEAPAEPTAAEPAPAVVEDAAPVPPAVEPEPEAAEEPEAKAEDLRLKKKTKEGWGFFGLRLGLDMGLNYKLVADRHPLFSQPPLQQLVTESLDPAVAFSGGVTFFQSKIGNRTMFKLGAEFFYRFTVTKAPPDDFGEMPNVGRRPGYVHALGVGPSIEIEYKANGYELGGRLPVTISAAWASDQDRGAMGHGDVSFGPIFAIGLYAYVGIPVGKDMSLRLVAGPEFLIMPYNEYGGVTVEDLSQYREGYVSTGEVGIAGKIGVELNF